MSFDGSISRVYIQEIARKYSILDSDYYSQKAKLKTRSDITTLEIYVISDWYTLTSKQKGMLIKRYNNPKSRWSKLINFHPHLLAQMKAKTGYDRDTYVGNLRYNLDCIDYIDSSLQYYEIQTTISRESNKDDDYTFTKNVAAKTMLLATTNRYENTISFFQDTALIIAMGTHPLLGEWSLFIDIPDDIMMLIMDQFVKSTRNK